MISIDGELYRFVITLDTCCTGQCKYYVRSSEYSEFCDSPSSAKYPVHRKAILVSWSLAIQAFYWFVITLDTTPHNIGTGGLIKLPVREGVLVSSLPGVVAMVTNIDSPCV